VLHLDLQVVDPDQPVAAEVPLALQGDPVELHHADGVLDQQLFSLSVKAKPADIPGQLSIDISALTVGASIRVSDIALPEGVTTDVDLESPVVVGLAPRVSVEAVGEEAEAAEGGQTASSGGEES
jgi:large subunit ribosomal protein L25